jgi:hypothetical protein
MKARAIRNAYTDALAAGQRFPPRSQAGFFGAPGYRGRTKACIECLAAGVCKCRASDFRESFCISDALLRAAILGDTTRGLFYTGQSVTRIPERTVGELKTVQEVIDDLEETVAPSAAPARGLGFAEAAP